MSNSPNILFIVADQHNAKVLGHKGHPDARTPHLDRMAREGPLQVEYQRLRHNIGQAF